MDLYKYHDSPDDLKGHDSKLDRVPALAWKEFRDNKKELLKRKHIFTKSPKWAFTFAQNVYQSAWPEGEDAIAKDGYYAFLYAYHNLNQKPFPKGEDAIAKSDKFAYEYAKSILDAPFIKGEPVIAQDPNQAKHYVDRFPEREEAIAKLQAK